MDSLDQFPAGEGMEPGPVFAAAGADFGNNHHVGRVGMKCLLDNLICHVRTVKVAGVDVVHARANRLSQNSDRCVNVPWRSPNFGAGKLHGAVAHSVQIRRGSHKFESAPKLRRFGHCVFPPNREPVFDKMESASE